MSRHRNRIVDDLELVDHRDDGRRLVDDAHRAGQRELEVAVASTLTESRAAGVDGDAAGYDQIDRPISPGDTDTPSVDAPLIVAA